MNTTSNWPLRLPSWLRYIAVWVFLMLICAPQTMWSGTVKSWSEVFWIQVIYWTDWAILTLPIFWLCQYLYDGPRTWPRYAVGLLIGTAGVALLHPVIENSLRFAKEWVEWRWISHSNPPEGFPAKVGTAVLKGSGTNPFMFAVIACVWHAKRYASDLRDRKIQALELETQLRKAQLQALRNQLNPHFLFNTLHSIAELVHEDPDLAEQLVVRLGELLRKVLASSDQHEIPLAEEIDFIKAYLDIEQMRLGDRLKVEWDIDPNTLSLKVPGLVLQPLVENAIQHGIASSNQAGKLNIRVRHENGFLHLQVRDTGPGMRPDKAPANAGIGLSNTDARLRTLYGDRYRFEWINDHGLSVHMHLPLPCPT